MEFLVEVRVDIRFDSEAAERLHARFDSNLPRTDTRIIMYGAAHCTAAHEGLLRAADEPGIIQLPACGVPR